MTIGRALRSLPGRLPLGGMLAVLAASLLVGQPAAAQTCQPDKLYDIITSSFHQSVAQRTDGSWAGWGENMGALGDSGATGSGPTYVYNGNSVGRPLDIIDGGAWASG